VRAVIATTLLAGLSVLAACATETTSAPSSPPSDSQVKADRENVGDIGDVSTQTALSATRAVQRMPIAVLEASIPVVAGSDIKGPSITWKEGNNEALADNIYGAVLGRPDFITVTEENSAPSSLYVKFMRDMARNVCSQISTSDHQRSSYSETTLWRFAPIDGSVTPEQINENLRYLTLRFLGMRLTTDDPYIEKLRAVFEAGRETSNQGWAGLHGDAEGWRTVCIGLLESPAFHID
jgi:hypothetical protein